MIEIRNISQRFAGPRGWVEALHNVNLSIPAGEVFGIIGRSGAGKSTLVRTINLLTRPSEGNIVVNGRDLTTLPAAQLREARREIGMIFQHFNLLSSRTVYENVALPLELAGMKRDEIEANVLPLLELVGLSAQKDRYPAQISGGQKQRVGIARALASKPKVLLSDEATSALDPETTQSILALLKDINRKLALTILLITHEMPVIKAICDRVAVLDRGVVVEQGPVFDVFTGPKSDVTRSMVRDLVDRELPDWLTEKMNASNGAGNPILRITFSGPHANEPVIADLVKRFDVVLNIIQANVDYIQGLPFGIIIVEADGSEGAIDAAIAHVNGQNLKAEVLGHVAGDDRAVA